MASLCARAFLYFQPFASFATSPFILEKMFWENV